MATRKRGMTLVCGAVFYGGLLAAMAGILSQRMAAFVPSALADSLGRNSEGVVLALLLAAWIQVARPCLVESSWQWQVTVSLAGGFLIVGVLLISSDLPSRIRTLNEAFLGAGVLVPLIQGRAALSGRVVTAVSVGVLTVVAVAHASATVINLAEGFGVVVLAVVGLYAVDRGILDERAETSVPVRYGWYAFLVIGPVAFSELQYGVGVGGTAGDIVGYAVRLTEAFVGMLLVQLYFAIGLGRTGRAGGGPSRTRPSAGVRGEASRTGRVAGRG